MSYTVAIHDGWLCIKWTDPDFNEPRMIANYYPVERYTSYGKEWADKLNGREARQEPFGNGLYHATTSDGMSGISVKLQLRDGLKTMPIHGEITPIPCPKVRKGIETEYRNGRWMKCLRTGWESA